MAKRSRTRRTSPAPVASARSSSSLLGKFLSGPWCPWLPAAVAFLVYLPSLRSDFVSDARLEMDEGFVTSISNLPKVISLQVLGMHLMLSDRPGEMLYLMLNAAVWGTSPLGFHLSSILLHVANVALLGTLLRRLVGAELESTGANSIRISLALAAVTLLFALHPVATESVAEVSFSSSLLVTFFVLGGLLAGTAFRPGAAGPAHVAAVVGIGCALAAVLAKESGIAVSLLLVVYWFLFRRGEARKPWFLFLAAGLAVTVATLAAVLPLATSDQMKLDYLGGSFSSVFLIQPRLWIFMLGQLLWPTHLAADYTLEDMPLLATTPAIAILLIVVALQAALALRSRVGALGVAMWWLGLAPVSNLVPLYCILADRFYYLPLAGLALQLAGAFILLQRFPRIYFPALATLFAALPFLAFLTIQREAVFANETALWADTLQKSPHSTMAHTSWGVILFRQRRLDQARDQFEQALADYSRNSSACVCIGLVDAAQGRLEPAIARFQQALAINPENDDAHLNLGIAFCRQGRVEDGVREFQDAIAVDSYDASAHTNLALALTQEGHDADAARELRTALQIAPDSVRAHYALGNVLARQGSAEEAAEQFQAVLKIKPDYIEARADLGVTYLHRGSFDLAIVQFQKALILRPDSAELHNNLGVALAQKGDAAQAMTEFQEALHLKPDFDSARANLAKAEAASQMHP